MPKIVADLNDVAQQTGQARQLDPSALSDLEDTVSDATIDVYAATDDDSLRRFELDLDARRPARRLRRGRPSTSRSGSPIRASEQTISAPTDAQPLADLLSQIPGGAAALGLGSGAEHRPPPAAAGPADKYYDCVAKAKDAAGGRRLRRADQRMSSNGPTLNRAFFLGPDGWPYLLVPFIPLAIALELIGASPTVIFFVAAIGIIPTAALMGRATEELAERSGPGIGGLLNVTFGNAPELIIALFALNAGPAGGRQGVDHRLDPRQRPARPRRGDGRRRHRPAGRGPEVRPDRRQRRSRRCSSSPPRRC